MFGLKNTISKKSIRGFTLTEILVVVAIIGVFAATLIGLVDPSSSAKKANDTKRKADLNNMQKALELYKQDQLPISYPADATWNATACASPWTATNTTYMNKFPCDPSTTTRYSYTRNPSDTTRYTLYACLENKSDTDGTVQAGCPSGKMYQVTEP